MILVAEVCLAERKEEHIKELLSRGYTMAEAMANFLDNYAKAGQEARRGRQRLQRRRRHGHHPRPGLQQVVKPLSELAPSKTIEPASLKELEPPRDDVVELAARYRSTGEEMRRSESDAA